MKKNLRDLRRVALVVACAAAAGPATSQISAATAAPVLLPGCELPSPRLMRAAAPFGVDMDLTVLPDGSVDKVEFRKAAVDDGLNNAFIEAARLCRFTPARILATGESTSGRATLSYAMVGNEPQLLGLARCFPVGYPPLSRRLGEEGLVVIDLYQPREGGPPLTRVSRSSGSVRLDAMALSMVTACLSKPEVHKDLPVRFQQPVRFQLDRATPAQAPQATQAARQEQAP